MKDNIFVKVRSGFVVSGFTVEGKQSPSLAISRNDITVSFGSARYLAEFCSLFVQAGGASFEDAICTDHFSLVASGNEVEWFIESFNGGYVCVVLRSAELAALCELAGDVQIDILCSQYLSPMSTGRGGYDE